MSSAARRTASRAAIDDKLYTTPEDALATAEALGTGENGRYLLAATFGNVHGVYKPGNVKLRPEILQEIQDAVGAKVGSGTTRCPTWCSTAARARCCRRSTRRLDFGVVKMNVDTDTQYAYTRAVAGHMFANYDGVLKIDGEVGSKKTYDPRAWGKASRGVDGGPRRRGLPGVALDRRPVAELMTTRQTRSPAVAVRPALLGNLRRAQSALTAATLAGGGSDRWRFSVPSLPAPQRPARWPDPSATPTIPPDATS